MPFGSEFDVPPESSGGMGTIYEYRVASVALVTLLCEGHMPFGVGLPLARVSFQQRITGHHLDDVVFTSPSGRKVVVQAQVKKNISITGSNRPFIDVLAEGLRAHEANAEAIARGEMLLGLIAEGDVGQLHQLRKLTQVIRHLPDVRAVRLKLREGVIREALRRRYRQVLNAMAVVMPEGTPAEVEEAARLVLSALHIWIADAGPGGADERAALDALRRIPLPEGMYPVDLLHHIYEIATIYGPQAAQVDREHLIRTIRERSGIQVSAGRAAGSQPRGNERAARQLPAPPIHFRGRSRELGILGDLATGVNDGGEQGQVVVISGRPGVGKTALAIQAGAQLRESFSGAQLFADLRGVGGIPADPSDVLRQFLRDLRLSDEEIPLALDEKAALFRSRVAESPVLVVLDNAADSAQVRPLLPGPGPSLTIVTSRNSGLAIVGSRFLRLGELSPAESAEFLALATSRPGYREDPQILRIAELCGHLPLALRIVSSILAGWDGWTPSYLAKSLEDRHGLLDKLEQDGTGVRASFELSYQILRPAARQAFRRMSVIPDSQFPSELGAIAAGCEEKIAASIVENLVAANLVDRGTRDGDIRLHDLIRVYAHEKLEKEEGRAGQREAEARVMRSVLNWLHATTKVLSDHKRYRPDDMARSLRLIDMDWALIRGVLNLAIKGKLFGDLAVILDGLRCYVEMRGLWDFWAELGAAMSAAADSPDVTDPESKHLGRLVPLIMIATAKLRMHDADGAIAAAADLESIAPDVENPVLRAEALNEIGNVMRETRNWQKALSCYEEAKALLRKAGMTGEAASTTYNIGNVYRDRGQYEAAIEAYEEELAHRHASSDRWNEAVTLNSLVGPYSRVGRIDDAIAAYSTAIEIFEVFGDAANMSACLHDIGISLVRAGRPEEGIPYIERDLEIESRRGNHRGMAISMSTLGQALISVGDERGEGYLYKAIEMAREAGDPGTESYAAILMAMVQARAGTGSIMAIESALNSIREHRGIREHAEFMFACSKIDHLPRDLRIRYLNDAIAAFGQLGNVQDGDEAREALRDLLTDPGSD
jgi:tetratricopeptide (TPR) repeat protein